MLIRDIKNITVKAHKQIEPNNFDVFVNCTTDKPFFEGKINHRLGVEDNGDIRQYDILYNLLIHNECEIFKLLTQYITEGKQCCIFCNQGRQRSCCTYVCYLIYRGVEMNEAIEYLKSVKKDAFFSNINFKDTIVKFNDYVSGSP